MPPPIPKNETPSTSTPEPCRTRALGHPTHAARSSSKLSLFPGTKTAGIRIACNTRIQVEIPLRALAKSPAPTTTSASRDSSTIRLAAETSVCKSLKRTSFISPGEFLFQSGQDPGELIWRPTNQIRHLAVAHFNNAKPPVVSLHNIDGIKALRQTLAAFMQG